MKSTTLDEESKKKIKPVLNAKFMSSEESAVETDGSGDADHDSSDSERVSGCIHKKKKLIQHKLPWRSEEFEKVLQSLDRKVDRRRDARSKAMCLKVEVSGDSLREKPADLPEWASNLHHELFS